MLTSVVRFKTSSSSSPHYLTRYLLSYASSLPNTRQFHSNENKPNESYLTHFLINLHSWKLTHQPREPRLHWSSRFRQPKVQTEDTENDQSSEYWDSWFKQHQSPSLLPLSQQASSLSLDRIYFLDQSQTISMPKRSRDLQSPEIEIPRKRDKYSQCKFHNRSYSGFDSYF